MIDEKSSNRNKIWLYASLLIFLVSACGILGATPNEPAANSPTQPPTDPPPATDSPLQPTEDQSETDTVPPETDPTEEQPSLGAKPILIEFMTSDGRKLEGQYYPPKISPAPLLVLMHWAPGSQDDWRVLVPWFQNSGAQAEVGSDTWLDPSWFPHFRDDVSFGVFTFNFGGFGNSEGIRSDFKIKFLDAAAAVSAASKLEGIDPQKIITMGASLGADGAVDGCLLFNTQVNAGTETGRCLGAFSLSPGSFLSMDYADTVSQLDNSIPPVKTYCIAALGDRISEKTCVNTQGANGYQRTSYEGNFHGMELIRPIIGDNPLILFIRFLENVLEMNIQP